MVDLQLTNKKLEERAKRIVMMLAGIEYGEAAGYLNKADHHVKTALLMALTGLDIKEAEFMLRKHNGFIRKALQEHQK